MELLSARSPNAMFLSPLAKIPNSLSILTQSASKAVNFVPSSCMRLPCGLSE